MLQAKGFSLIELMVVIAIVAVLSGIAVPFYKEHIVRSQVSKFLPLMESIKTEVVTTHDKGVRFTSSVYKVIYDVGDTGKPAGIDFLYIGYYGVVDMRLDGAYFGLESNPWILLVPIENQGTIKWTCAYHVSMDVSMIKYLPSICQQVISRSIGFTSSNGLSYGADVL